MLPTDIKTNLSACRQPLRAALRKSRSMSAEPWQCWPTHSPGNDHTWGEKHILILTEWPLSAQTAPGAKDRCNKLTEAYISIFLWLWNERCWLPVKKLKTSQFLSPCWLPTQRIQRGLLRHWHSMLKNVGLKSNPNLRLPFFSLVLLFGKSHNRSEPKFLRDLWKSCGDEMSVEEMFSKWGGHQ